MTSRINFRLFYDLAQLPDPDQAAEYLLQCVRDGGFDDEFAPSFNLQLAFRLMIGRLVRFPFPWEWRQLVLKIPPWPRHLVPTARSVLGEAPIDTVTLKFRALLADESILPLLSEWALRDDWHSAAAVSLAWHLPWCRAVPLVSQTAESNAAGNWLAAKSLVVRNHTEWLTRVEELEALPDCRTFWPYDMRILEPASVSFQNLL